MNQAGDEGAIVSEFSSTSRDAFDEFTDPRIRRVPDIPEGFQAYTQQVGATIEHCGGTYLQ